MNFYYKKREADSLSYGRICANIADSSVSAPIVAKNSPCVKHNLIIQKTHSLLFIVTVVGKEAGEVKLK